MKLGVNIDHIALLREARKVNDPDPLEALFLAKRAGADQITIHLREDRRHINEDDLVKIIQNSPLPVNVECSVNSEIIEIVAEAKPSRVTIVPEKREELTTEGGLNFDYNYQQLDNVAYHFKRLEIEVSLFIDPNIESIKSSKGLAVDWIELHTGKFANIYAMLNSNLSRTRDSIKELELSRSKLKRLLKNSIEELNNIATEAKEEYGFRVAGGHGLNYQNVTEILHIQAIEELNIGQSIIARSIYTGFENAVREMKQLISNL